MTFDDAASIFLMAPLSKGPRKQVLVRMPFSLYTRIRDRADDKGQRLNDTILRAIDHGLEDKDDRRDH